MDNPLSYHESCIFINIDRKLVLGLEPYNIYGTFCEEDQFSVSVYWYSFSLCLVEMEKNASGMVVNDSESYTFMIK